MTTTHLFITGQHDFFYEHPPLCNMQNTPHKPSPQSQTVCRVHSATEADHQGKILIELITREPSGAMFVQQHRVEPKLVQPFIAYQQQQFPNFQAEQSPSRSQYTNTPQPTQSPQQQAPQQPPQHHPHMYQPLQPQQPNQYQPQQPQVTNAATRMMDPQTSHGPRGHHGQPPNATNGTSNMSSSSIGGFSGYDKYCSSYGNCAQGAAGAPFGGVGSGMGVEAPRADGRRAYPPATTAVPHAQSLIKDPNNC